MADRRVRIKPVTLRSYGLNLLVVILLALGLLAPALAPAGAPGAAAASVVSASFGGGSGTAVVGGTLYAKQGASLTLNVTTSSDTRCVVVTGDHSATQTSNTDKSSWSFNFTAGSGDGPRTVTVTAYRNNGCNQSPGSGIASYVVDNTPPTVTASLSPAPNAAGWNNSNVTITWSATDSGSGVASGPSPATDTVTTETSGVTRSATATDRVGNTGTGTVTVKLDKTQPTITASRSPAPTSFGWNNTNVTVSFTCSDTLSGIKSCTGTQVVSTEGTNQSVSGTAVDNADNSAPATVSGISIDKTPPSLSGSPTTAPNGAGWYNGDVTIQWEASDGLSGIDPSTIPADSVITGEGTGLYATASVSDKAGNTTTANSPSVKIDRTKPATTVSVVPTGWTNMPVSLTLSASDNLSGVAQTYWQLDGGSTQTGTSVSINTEGNHTLSFWSVDNAGNVEDANTVQVKIDLTPPSIGHTLTPTPNAAGWNNTDVTVTFTCTDALSGIASCTNPVTVSTEGAGQSVSGTATDNADNTAADTVTVNVDKTQPTITASRSPAPNSFGWNNTNVTVSFTCSDTLSGVKSCTAPVTVSTEGANQQVTGQAVDNADNSASATVSGISIDKTPPSLSGAPTTPANSHGWYNGDVTIQWEASDGLSGIDPSTMPADSVITGEGDNLSASASVSDKAGNITTATVGPIKIDRTPPVTTASVPDPFPSGWYAGPVTLTLNALDTLSDVDVTYYSVDNGAPQVYSGPFTFSLGGVHEIRFWSVDNAGNVEDSSAADHVITIKIDNIPPTITGFASPAPNGNGWNNTPVTVTFYCQDNESGIASCPDPVTLSTEGANQSVLGTAKDNAGNTESTTVGGIKIDLTPPVTASDAPPGWTNNAGVTVNLSATDNLSGVAQTYWQLDGGSTQTGTTITVSGEGIHSLTFWSVDNADNVEGAKSAEVKIDRTPPQITLQWPGASISDGQSFYFGDVPPAPTCLASDALSGVNGGCTVSGYGTSIGSYTLIATAADNAGNVSSETIRYTVLPWTLRGFYAPVDMSTGSTLIYNVVKAGSTVPLKFEAFKGNTELTDTAVVVQPPKAQLANCAGGAAADEIEMTATGGTSLRYDTTAGQFIYNWQTPKTGAGRCYLVTVALQDGSSISAYFKLK